MFCADNMELKISKQLYQILVYARDEAMRTGHLAINADHLMLAIIRHEDNAACGCLASMGISIEEMKRYIDDRSLASSYVPYSDIDNMKVARSAGNVISMAAFEALRAEAHEILPVHLLLAYSRVGDAAGVEFLRNSGVDTSSLADHLIKTHRVGPVIAPDVSAVAVSQDFKTKSVPAPLTSMIDQMILLTSSGKSVIPS